MKQTTREWIDKAEDDWHVAQMSYRARKRPSHDAVVFHAQQCAEKYLKAKLEEEGFVFARKNDLLVLPKLVLPFERGWRVLKLFFLVLNLFAEFYLYLGMSVIKL